MRSQRTLIGLGLAAMLVLGTSPALAQAEEQPSPSADEQPSPSAEEQPSPSARATQVPLTTESGRPDLYLEMPYYIGGFEPEIVMVRGEEHFTALGPDDPTRMALEELLEVVGAETDDLVSGYALVSQEGFFAFVVAIRVNGAEPGTLWPAYQPILFDDLEDATAEAGSLGGKDVTIVTSVGEEGEYVELYAYDEGDTIWIVQGSTDVAENTLYNLPEPLEPEAGEDAG